MPWPRLAAGGLLLLLALSVLLSLTIWEEIEKLFGL